MKYFRLILAGLLVMIILPIDAKSQSKFPIFKNKGLTPPSRSRIPSGKSPIAPSRRTLFYNPSGWEFGAGGGVAYSLTDASGTSLDKKASFLNTQWSTADLNTGFFARYKIDRISAVNTTFHYARINGADSLAGRTRGFYFSNQIMELAVRYEVFVPFPALIPVDLYGFIGAAAFYHNPVLYVPNPAPADFTRDEYSLIQPAMPVGFGISYSYNDFIKIGYEMGWRKTFFDHLDGFTRPWSKGNDSYYFNSLNFTFVLPARRSPW
jgi:hypothetical protein